MATSCRLALIFRIFGAGVAAPALAERGRIGMITEIKDLWEGQSLKLRTIKQVQINSTLQ
jgi:hypothetical protein